jgi:nicotinate-nucleotide adenylyltransferase
VNESIAIYGGTFDPVHIGHLRSAIDVRSTLEVGRLFMVPSSTPPHRQKPSVTPADRLEMLRLSVTDLAGIEVDDREINRSGVSYSIDTLAEIRSEYPLCHIYFILGADAFSLLHTWHRWQELTDFAHLVVLERPGSSSPQPTDPVLEWRSEREIKTVSEFGAENMGRVLRLKLAQWQVSATDIRERCRTGQSIDLLVPKTVQSFIDEHKLYQ